MKDAGIYGIVVIRQDSRYKEFLCLDSKKECIESASEFIQDTQDIFIIYQILKDGTLKPLYGGDGFDYLEELNKLD